MILEFHLFIIFIYAGDLNVHRVSHSSFNTQAIGTEQYDLLKWLVRGFMKVKFQFHLSQPVEMEPLFMLQMNGLSKCFEVSGRSWWSEVRNPLGQLIAIDAVYRCNFVSLVCVWHNSKFQGTRF